MFLSLNRCVNQEAYMYRSEEVEVYNIVGSQIHRVLAQRLRILGIHDLQNRKKFYLHATCTKAIYTHCALEGIADSN